MAPHVKNERARLLRRREQLLQTWDAVAPECATEFRAVEAALKVMSAPSEARYMQFRVTKDAVRACLEFEGEPLPKKVIADRLFNGGFVMDPEVGRKLVVENITKNIQRGIFTISSDGLVSLPEWNGQSSTSAK